MREHIRGRTAQHSWVCRIQTVAASWRLPAGSMNGDRVADWHCRHTQAGSSKDVREDGRGHGTSGFQSVSAADLSTCRPLQHFSGGPLAAWESSKGRMAGPCHCDCMLAV